MIPRALNQKTAPSLSYEGFLDLAAAVGCIGVEPRNDLGRPLFDGIAPAEAGRMARDRGLRLLGLSQVYPFNDWSDARHAEIADLVEIARRAGAETVSLIPRVDGIGVEDGARQAILRAVLGEILPILRDAEIVGLVEPIGFSASSLKRKAEAVAAIEALGAEDCVKIVHDTFQHTLAGETEMFPAQTGIVHISGLSAHRGPLTDAQDGERVLIDAEDRLGNLAQIRELMNAGYDGAFSFECTAPAIHGLSDAETRIKASFEFLEAQIETRATL